jgi:hypothetical protein
MRKALILLHFLVNCLLICVRVYENIWQFKRKWVLKIPKISGHDRHAAATTCLTPAARGVESQAVRFIAGSTASRSALSSPATGSLHCTCWEGENE